jgi:hypothetical protein
MKLAINICTPISANQVWGDTFYAQNLANELLKFDIQSTIRFIDEWNDSTHNYDATLTITGKGKFQVRNHDIPNLCWVISHPECRRIEELEQFDFTWIASENFTKLVQQDLNNVDFLPQCTNFEFEKNPKPEIDVLFIGNNYYDNFNRRKIVDDFIKSGVDCNFKVIGKDWQKGLDPKYILTDFVNVDKLANYYRKAKIVLNDHHALMKRYGFINNRTYDLGKIKIYQISDKVEGLNKLAVTTYETPDELKSKIESALNSEQLRLRNVEISYRLMKDFTFKKRAEVIYTKLREFS